jgi:hypothetical protein
LILSDHQGIFIGVSEKLSELRQQIKNAMMPLLIHVFEMKLAAQSAKAPPSRLHTCPSIRTEEISAELHRLKSDMEALDLWIEGVQKQIDKALCQCETQTPPLDETRVQPKGEPLPAHLNPAKVTHQGV